MYLLVDTFNKRIISRHRTLAALVAKRRAYALAVERANGRGSYIPTDVRVEQPKRGSTSSAYERSRPLDDREVVALNAAEDGGRS